MNALLPFVGGDDALFWSTFLCHVFYPIRVAISAPSPGEKLRGGSDALLRDWCAFWAIHLACVFLWEECSVLGVREVIDQLILQDVERHFPKQVCLRDYREDFLAFNKLTKV